MGSKRLRTVIQTDESLSPKPSWWSLGQCSSPQIKWAFWRGAVGSLCSDLLMHGHPPEPNQLMSDLIDSQVCPSSHHWPLQHLILGYKTSQIPGTTAGRQVCRKLLAFGRANMPLAVPQPPTTSCAQGCASHCSVCAAWGLGVGRGFQGAGGDVARPTAHSAVQRKWDETILPIQQHSPSHKPWQWLPAHQSCPFLLKKGAVTLFPPVGEKH